MTLADFLATKVAPMIRTLLDPSARLSGTDVRPRALWAPVDRDDVMADGIPWKVEVDGRVSRVFVSAGRDPESGQITIIIRGLEELRVPARPSASPGSEVPA